MAKARASRRLFLHLSALSDVEYGVYTEALHDLLDSQSGEVSDDELEMRRVGAREVRAWMKGRFRDLTVTDIDKVLHLLAPQAPDGDEFTGGQLLAALRLFMHARHGEEISEAGVFMQADPSSPTGSYPSPFSAHSSKSADVKEKRSFQTHRRPLVDQEMLLHTDSSIRAPTSVRGLATVKPLSAMSTPGSPVSKRASLPSSAPPIPSAFSKPRSDLSSEVTAVPAGSMNPFLQRAKTHTGSIHAGGSESSIPPLPPRKPSHMSAQGLSSAQLLSGKPGSSLSVCPPRATSLSNRSISNSSTTANPSPSPPPPPPPPPLLSRTSRLDRHSVESSSTGTLGRFKVQVDRDHALQPARTSLDSARDRVHSLSRSPDKGPRRRPPRPPSPRSERPTTSAPIDTQSPGVSEQAIVNSNPPLSRRHSPDRAGTYSMPSESEDEGAKEPRGSRSLSSSEQYAAPPMHPARRTSIHVSSVHSTPRNVQHARQSRSPSFHVSSNPTHTAKPASSPIHTRTASSSSSPSPSRSPVSPNGGDTTTQRTARSYSMMHTPMTGSASGRHSPPLPPPRRKRPESMQLTQRTSRTQDTDHKNSNNAFSNALTNAFGRRALAGGELPSPPSPGFGSKQRQERDHSPSTSSTGVSTSSFSFAQLRETFSALQQRAQPTLDRVRYKAEAGLAPRRGYVAPNSRVDLPAHLQHLAGESAGNRLMPHKLRPDEDSNVIDLDSGNECIGGGGEDVRGMPLDSGGEDDISLDEWGGGGTTADMADGEITVRGRKGRLQYMQERDNLKLPEGTGWTLLR